MKNEEHAHAKMRALRGNLFLGLFLIPIRSLHCKRGSTPRNGNEEQAEEKIAMRAFFHGRVLHSHSPVEGPCGTRTPRRAWDLLSCVRAPVPRVACSSDARSADGGQASRNGSFIFPNSSEFAE